MKRSEINGLVLEARACFAAHGWALPPNPRWDVTDFGLGDWRKWGLVLVNLAEEPEYCEKLMYARQGMATPAHRHLKKKEDIIARWGTLEVRVRGTQPSDSVSVNGIPRTVGAAERIVLRSGERITLPPGIVHEFQPLSEACIMGEVSTANDDAHDNVFEDPNVGRFPQVDEDEPALIRLVSDQ